MMNGRDGTARSMRAFAVFGVLALAILGATSCTTPPVGAGGSGEPPGLGCYDNTSYPNVQDVRLTGEFGTRYNALIFWSVDGTCPDGRENYWQTMVFASNLTEANSLCLAIGFQPANNPDMRRAGYTGLVGVWSCQDMVPFIP